VFVCELCVPCYTFELMNHMIKIVNDFFDEGLPVVVLLLGGSVDDLSRVGLTCPC
jgi:hypothetical protein